MSSWQTTGTTLPLELSDAMIDRAYYAEGTLDGAGRPLATWALYDRSTTVRLPRCRSHLFRQVTLPPHSDRVMSFSDLLDHPLSTINPYVRDLESWEGSGTHKDEIMRREKESH